MKTTPLISVIQTAHLMKISALLLFLAIGTNVFAQSSLDGKKFTVILYIQKQRDSVDTLKFENNTMTFSSARTYGFVTESLKLKEKNGNIHFVSTGKSKKNGDIVWEGTVMNDSIAGTMIWDKVLQNPVNYTFTGKRSDQP
jgi:hypothetical protein